MRINITTNAKKLSEYFADRASAIKETAAKILRLAGAEVENSVRRKLSGEVLRAGSGNLLKSVKVSEDFENLKISIEVNAPYARVHEFGAEIRARREKFLTFQPKPGEWRRARSVRIPARPFLRPSLEENLSKIEEISLRAIKETI